MKRYLPIYVGTRWATNHPWGVMFESEAPAVRELLCVGCTEDGAREMADRLNGKLAGGAVEQPAGEEKAKRKLWGFGLVLALALCGCTASAPLKGGKAVTTNRPAEGLTQSVVQSENPAAVSRQNQEVVRVKTYTVPGGSRLEEARVRADGAALVTNLQAVLVSAPML